MSSQLKHRYLVVGFLNTCFGYAVGIITYLFLEEMVPILLIAVLINIITISFSFTTYKVFVFKTKDQWLREYLRSYSVYGLSALISIFTLWLFIAKVGMSIYLSQALTIGLTVTISYLGHKHFTFKR